MNIVTRAQWGARAPKYINRGAMLAQSTCHYNGPDVVVAGKKSWDHSKCAGLVRGIQNFHMDGRGWSDIAYNFVICPHGYTFEGRGLNTYNGANGTNSGNRSSHAIMCLAGEGNAFTDAEKVEFRQCVEYVVEKTKCHTGCMGHRDHKSTACPGDIRYKWVHAGMPVPNAPVPAPKPTPEPVKEKDDMPAGFLVKLDKDRREVLQVSSAREVHWVRDSVARKGYQLQNELDGGNQEVCTLDADDTTDHIVKLRAMVLNLPFVGEMPEVLQPLWKGPHKT